MLNEPELRAILTTWGVIKLDIVRDGLVRCRLPRLQEIPKDTFAVLEAGSDVYSCYVRQLLEGGTPALPPLGRLDGTAFQKKVWNGLLNIPRGETRSYRDIAEAIGNARSVRAVANACGRNPAPLFIPCHRVIRTDGSLGGFSSGPAWKRLLLAVEQLNC